MSKDKGTSNETVEFMFEYDAVEVVPWIWAAITKLLQVGHS